MSVDAFELVAVIERLVQPPSKTLVLSRVNVIMLRIGRADFVAGVLERAALHRHVGRVRSLLEQFAPLR